MKKIYLGGAFAQYTANEVRQKQAEVERLLPPSIKCLKPQHRDDYDLDLGYEAIGSILTARDNEMIKACDLLLLDVLGATKASGGTFIEIGWASEMRKPIVLIAEEGNVHRHVMALNLVTVVVETRAQAAQAVIKILGEV